MHPTLPTTDLYFLNACGDQVRGLWRRGPVRRLGANAFRSAGATLVIRRDEQAVIDRILDDDTRPLIYLIDDNVAAGLDDPTLPDGYRARLRHFHDGQYQALLARADTVVTASAPLAALHNDKADVRVLDPAWHVDPADDRHFAAAENGGALQMVHLGSGSHGEAHGFLGPIIADLLHRYPQLHFTCFSAAGTLEGCAPQARLRILSPLRWSRYRRWVARQRFHVALYPSPDTAFQRARSVNKMLEHGVVGAVGLYGDTWAGTPLINQGQNGYALAHTRAAWSDCLTALLDDPAQLRGLYNTGRPLIARLNDPARQRRFWNEVFINRRPLG